MKKVRRPFMTPLRLAGTIVLGLVVAGLGLALFLKDKNVAVLNPKGLIADQQLDLILITTGLGLLVIIPVFIMLFGFAWKYRATNPKETKYEPDIEGNRLIETVWWGIPIIIIGVLSVITWVTTHQLDPYKSLASDKAPLKVQVVSLQWRWLFLYPTQEIATINELRIPEKTPIEFEITADSPMSAFWIPNLGTQTYAMNGMTTKLSLMADEPGTYHGSNTNISGEGYASMRFKAIAMKESEFEAWAKTVNTQSSKHLDQSLYAKIARQSKDMNVQYFMLHDTALFGDIQAKFGGHGQQPASEHEGMGH